MPFTQTSRCSYLDARSGVVEASAYLFLFEVPVESVAAGSADFILVVRFWSFSFSNYERSTLRLLSEWHCINKEVVLRNYERSKMPCYKTTKDLFMNSHSLPFESAKVSSSKGSLIYPEGRNSLMTETELLPSCTLLAELLLLELIARERGRDFPYSFYSCIIRIRVERPF